MLNWIYLVDFSLVIFFSATFITQLLGTLKTILIANKGGILSYILTGIDALIYVFVIKSLGHQTTLTIILFVLAKVLGTIMGDLIESKLAFGIYDIDLYVKEEDTQHLIHEALLNKGFSSTMLTGNISRENCRYMLNIQLLRKDYKKLLNILDDFVTDEATMVVRQAKKVTGKIHKHILDTN